ncbi:P-loop containing nucleoside triphosphate hydrolase protein [Gymnopilus junonius]|uniref:P-loop containing nucleoside triphosphate hydrolase protein n=1 Tax=Gymnopilus junonius TaxID=109634 RepID=A0A9P5NDV5_GYMJU|nr:P-loop containing nucleoside triphosphate hydrolase protein [Gymnopilus junonius]
MLLNLGPEADIVASEVYNLLLTYAQLQRQHSSFKLNPTSKAAAPIFHYSWYRQINDEAHKFRNPSTTTAKAVWAVSKQHGHCLTGTPAQNSLLDFHPLFKFLGVTHENVDVLNIYEQKIYSKRQQGPIINKSAKKLFDLIKKDFCIFRSKSDVDSETGRPLVMLPSCTDLIIDIALSVEERIIYSHIKEMSLHIFATLTRLRQACDHPSLVQRVLQDGAGSDQSEENISLRTMVKSQGSLATMSRKLPRAARNPFSDFFRSSKLKAMLQILHKCKGQKTIIFTHFTSFIPVIAQALHSANIRWAEYTGGTSHKDQEEALMQIAEDEECSVIIISILAGSVGLNITSCNKHYTHGTVDQAIARVHRIGQMLPITVYRLVVQESIEKSILKKQQLKREMIGDMYGDVAGDPCGDLDEATRRA